MAAKFGLLIDAKTKGENNIKRLGNSMQGVEGKAKNLGMAVRGVGNAFKALFAAAAVAGFSAFVKGAIDSADAFGKLSTRTGIAADKLQAYANAGKLADVSQSDLETGLRTLARTQGEAADGVKTYSEAYAKLGLSVKKADGSLKPSDQLLGEIADKFADLPNGPAKAAVAMDIFGRSGSKLITLLNGGSEALERFNYETSENFAQNAEMFNDKITTLQIQFNGFRAQLADALLPALNSIIEAFSTMFSAENDFTGFFQAVEISIRAVGVSIAATIMGITEIVALIKAAATAVGAVTLGRFEEAGQAISDYMSGAGQRYTGNKEVMDLLLGRIEAPTNYGGGGAGLDPVILQGGGTGTGTGQSKTAGALGRGLGKVGDVLKMLDGLKEQNRLLNAQLEGKREQVELDIQIEKMTKGLTPELAAHVEGIIRGNAALKDRIQKQEDLNNKTDKYKITLDQIKDTLANQITSAIEGLINGTKTLGESLSGLLKTFASMFLQSGVGSLVGSIFKSAKGNVFAQNGIVPYAKGGYISRPTLSLMGEAGPEAVLPLRRGRGGRLGVETSGSGVGSVVVNVDASGSSVQGNEPDANRLGRVIGQAVQAELIKQKRPGGLLTR